MFSCTQCLEIIQQTLLHNASRKASNCEKNPIQFVFLNNMYKLYFSIIQQKFEKLQMHKI